MLKKLKDEKETVACGTRPCGQEKENGKNFKVDERESRHRTKLRGLGGGRPPVETTGHIGTIKATG